MKFRLGWNNSDEAVFQLIKMNECLSDMFDQMVEMNSHLFRNGELLDKLVTLQEEKE